MLYVAGQSGVYRSTDNGQTWALFPSVDPQSPNTTPTPPGTGGGLPNVTVTDLDLALGNINPTTGRPDVSTGPNLLVATTFGRGSFAIRLAPVVFPNTPTQPSILTLAPADRFMGNNRITTNPAPTVIGLSEQSAFGNVVTVNLFDRATGTLIGTGQTDATGNFQIQVQAGFYTTNGLKTVNVQATDQSGTTGNVATLTFFLGTGYFPDLTPDTDNGRPAPPRDSDNLTNVAQPSFQGTMAGGNLLDPSTTVATIAAANGATQAGNTVTITTTAAHGLVVGQVVAIAGVTEAEYNGTFTVAERAEPDNVHLHALAFGPGRLGRGDGHRRHHGDGLRQRHGGRHRDDRHDGGLPDRPGQPGGEPGRRGPGRGEQHHHGAGDEGAARRDPRRRPDVAAPDGDTRHVAAGGDQPPAAGGRRQRVQCRQHHERHHAAVRQQHRPGHRPDPARRAVRPGPDLRPAGRRAGPVDRPRPPAGRRGGGRRRRELRRPGRHLRAAGRRR